MRIMEKCICGHYKFSHMDGICTDGTLLSVCECDEFRPTKEMKRDVE